MQSDQLDRRDEIERLRPRVAAEIRAYGAEAIGRKYGVSRGAITSFALGVAQAGTDVLVLANAEALGATSDREDRA